MADFFFAESDPDGRLARADARRICSAFQFEAAMHDHVPGGAGLAKEFGLTSDDRDYPIFIAEIQEHGDRATGSFGGDNKETLAFRKIGGAWKEDITPKPPLTSADWAQQLDEDNVAVEQITADIKAGKLKTAGQIRDALGNAMLNATPDVMFKMQGMAVSGDLELPVIRPRPATGHATASDRNTPSGAMDSFVVAIEHFDTAAIADSLYMPQDKDGICRKAVADEFAAGMRLLLAAEARFGNDNARGICFNCEVLDRTTFRHHTEDEWVVTTDYPDLAFGHSVVNDFQPGWVPLMHRGADRIWRIGPRFPQNARRVHVNATKAAAKAALLNEAATAIRDGKYANPASVVEALAKRLTQLEEE
jgi:hypothetical protein